jgi:hypothetical protein
MVINDKVYGYRRVNVADQRRDPNSLLNWTERMIRALARFATTACATSNWTATPGAGFVSVERRRRTDPIWI